MDPFFAIENDDFALLKEFKKSPSFANATNSFGYTPLEWAYLLGKTKAAGILETRSPKMLKIDQGEGIKKITPSELPHFFDAAYYSHLQFENPKILTQKLHEAPWMIAHTPIGKLIRQEGATYRTEISTGYVADTVIKWIDPEVGYGLFAGIDFSPNSYIAEYVGKIRDIRRLHKDLNPYCFHYPTRFFSWNYTVIDAFTQSNESRFINHSDRPNLQPHWVYDRGLMHLILMTAKFIPKGTQLTFDYGKDYWEYRQGKIDL